MCRICIVYWLPAQPRHRTKIFCLFLTWSCPMTIQCHHHRSTTIPSAPNASTPTCTRMARCASVCSARGLARWRLLMPSLTALNDALKLVYGINLTRSPLPRCFRAQRLGHRSQTYFSCSSPFKVCCGKNECDFWSCVLNSGWEQTDTILFDCWNFAERITGNINLSLQDSSSCQNLTSMRQALRVSAAVCMPRRTVACTTKWSCSRWRRWASIVFYTYWVCAAHCNNAIVHVYIAVDVASVCMHFLRITGTGPDACTCANCISRRNCDLPEANCHNAVSCVVSVWDPCVCVHGVVVQLLLMIS